MRFRTAGKGATSTHRASRSSASPSRTCAPVTASYLTAEYADNDWRGQGTESNSIVVTIQPKQAGVLYITLRSTMRTAGLGACAYVNGLPAGGDPFKDQQGWAVRRFAVTVDPPPVAARPLFQNVSLSTKQIILSQRIDVAISVADSGLASDDGRIVVGFPSLTDSADVSRVEMHYGGSALPAGAVARD